MLDTCPCRYQHTLDHDHARAYFVTVKDYDRTGWLAGPYLTHAQALAEIDRFNARCQELDLKAFWYAYGTASTAADEAAKIRTVFNLDGSIRQRS